RDARGNRTPDDGLLADDRGAPIAADAPNPDDPAPAVTGGSDAAMPAGPETAAVASAAGAADDNTSMDLAQAVELARAGRLVIRVQAVNELETQADIERYAAHTAREIHWRPLEARDLPQVALA